MAEKRWTPGPWGSFCCPSWHGVTRSSPVVTSCPTARLCNKSPRYSVTQPLRNWGCCWVRAKWSLDLVWIKFLKLIDRQILFLNFLFVSSIQTAVMCFQTKLNSACRRLRIWCNNWSARMPVSIPLSYMSSCKICFASILGRVYQLLMPWNYRFWIRTDHDENWKKKHRNKASMKVIIIVLNHAYDENKYYFYWTSVRWKHRTSTFIENHNIII